MILYHCLQLSPALRNRFTEIWCPGMASSADLAAIADHNLGATIHLGSCTLGAAIAAFLDWLRSDDLGRRCVATARDILAWTELIKRTMGYLSPAAAYVHGAMMTFLDGLGTGKLYSAGCRAGIVESLVQGFSVGISCTTAAIRMLNTTVLARKLNLLVNISQSFEIYTVDPHNSGLLQPIEKCLLYSKSFQYKIRAALCCLMAEVCMYCCLTSRRLQKR